MSLWRFCQFNKVINPSNLVNRKQQNKTIFGGLQRNFKRGQFSISIGDSTSGMTRVLDQVKHMFWHLDMSEKPTIKNILIRKNFSDITVKKFEIENWMDNRNLNTGIETLLRKNMFHILPRPKIIITKRKPKEKAAVPASQWLKCRDLKCVKKKLRKKAEKAGEFYGFYTFEVTSIRKAPEDMLINYRLNQYEMNKPKKPEQFGKPFYEDPECLMADPLTCSRMVNKNSGVKNRGMPYHMWYIWDVEYK